MGSQVSRNVLPLVFDRRHAYASLRHKRQTDGALCVSWAIPATRVGLDDTSLDRGVRWTLVAVLPRRVVVGRRVIQTLGESAGAFLRSGRLDSTDGTLRALSVKLW